MRPVMAIMGNWVSCTVRGGSLSWLRMAWRYGRLGRGQFPDRMILLRTTLNLVQKTVDFIRVNPKLLHRDTNIKGNVSAHDSKSLLCKVWVWEAPCFNKGYLKIRDKLNQHLVYSLYHKTDTNCNLIFPFSFPFGNKIHPKRGRTILHKCRYVMYNLITS